jgi:hypothetical protein
MLQTIFRIARQTPIPPPDRIPERTLQQDSQYARARDDATVALRQVTTNVSQ